MYAAHTQRLCALSIDANFEDVGGDFMSHKHRFQYFAWWPQIVCVMHTNFSTLCGLDRLCMLHTQTLCVLNIDAKSEDCRQVVHVSQIQTLVFCVVNSSGVSVCYTQTLFCLSST